MERWITRVVALIVALGALGLCWSFGMFTAVPLQQGRLLAMSGPEMQVVGVSLIGALGASWGALHLFSLADRTTAPAIYQAVRVVYLLAAAGMIGWGASWSMGRFVAG